MLFLLCNKDNKRNYYEIITSITTAIDGKVNPVKSEKTFVFSNDKTNNVERFYDNISLHFFSVFKQSYLERHIKNNFSIHLQSVESLFITLLSIHDISIEIVGQLVNNQSKVDTLILKINGDMPKLEISEDEVSQEESSQEEDKGQEEQKNQKKEDENKDDNNLEKEKHTV